MIYFFLQISNYLFNINFYSLLKDRMDTIDVDKAVDFVVRCMNFDGGFGCTPGSESHAGQVCLFITIEKHFF